MRSSRPQSKTGITGIPQKIQKLDNKFASEIVGDDNEIVGPFEAAAQQRFYRGQVIPLCL